MWLENQNKNTQILLYFLESLKLYIYIFFHIFIDIDDAKVKKLIAFNIIIFFIFISENKVDILFLIILFLDFI